MIQPLPLLTTQRPARPRTIASLSRAAGTSATCRQAREHDIPGGRARAHWRAVPDLHIGCRVRSYSDAQRWLNEGFITHTSKPHADGRGDTDLS